MSKRVFSGNFTQQEPIPEAAIAAATDVLRSGRLHRYNLVPGQVGAVAELERAYADWQGARYCLALTSGGQALQLGMRAAGVRHGDQVLTNSFTLAPVPGAIHAVGAKAVLVEIDDNLRLDLADLAAKAQATGARYLLLSHMRGHLCDMDALMQIAKSHGITVIEDCAHTMGAMWNGKRSGNFGLAGCFSTQTYKHINSGEGGLLTSDDPDFIARATIMSGSYMLYERHGAGPEAAHFEAPRYEQGNMSARMDHLRAAVLKPQLATLEANIARWNERYKAVAAQLAASNHVAVPLRPSQERMVGSSIQFRLPGFAAPACQEVLATAADRGVELKWFGGQEPVGFTSAHKSWRYVDPQSMPQSDATMATLFDMRLPLTFSVADCALIGEIITDVVSEVAG